jgi:hypothetical protein
MPNAQTETQQSILKRTIGLWPYVFIAISVIGFGYMALIAAR